MDIKLQFLGAARTVTGSKYLLTYHRKNYLIDCGLFQGLKQLRLRNWRALPVNPSQIDAVILTHAHMDHSGYLPLLVKEGFAGKIFSTRATQALCEVLLPDSGFLQEEDARFATKYHFSRHEPALPLYTEADARRVFSHFQSVEWQQPLALAKDVMVTFHPAGHILGAAIVELNVGGRTIIFSGDLGRQKQLTMNPPEALSKADYLIMESTYGDRIHSKEDPKKILENIIVQTYKRRGTVLIPSFAVGRAQELLFLLSTLKKEKKLPNIPIYVNSPMALQATRLFCEFQKEQALSMEQCRELSDVAQFVSSVEESKKLNALQKPAVIISASGMATGGRVLHHLKFLASDPKNTILFVGYQATGTRGDAMLSGAKHIKIHGEEISIRAQVLGMDTLSAHADQTELFAWLKNFARPPRITFLTHGETGASEALRHLIEEKYFWHCQIPDYLEAYWLD